MKQLLSVKKVFIALFLLCISLPVFSQGQDGKLKMDPAIRYGKLANGLTYYIRHNEMPKERAEFYIVHNVGSMQEEENQRGLAHFLEHMAFNGTKNFPSKKGIQDYVESVGMLFGQNLNAYTSFDETVYMLMNVPVTREGIIDSCLLVLHDWSSFILLDDEAIEKERGVVREEWRTGRTAQMRMWEQQLPDMFPGSQYGVRIPIGTIDVIDNFKKEELEAFYKKWYRPDLQALIIVGDIDVDQIEGKIKKMFTDIPASVNPAPKEEPIVPNNSKPIISIAKDKEMPNTLLSIYYKHDKIPEALKGTIADLVVSYAKNVVSIAMSERFSEISQKPDPPFIAAFASDGDYSVSKSVGAWTAMAVVKPGELDRAMNTLVMETERVKKYGITEAEYERARDNVLKWYESAYKDRDKNKNNSFAEEYVRNFTNGECIPGIEVEYEFIKKIAEDFPVAGINQFIKQLFIEGDNEKNLVISLTGPDKEDVTYPSVNELYTMFRAASNETVSENENEVISKILIPELPKPGKIISEKEEALFGGVTLYTLSNGVRVAVKQTEYKDDEILVSAKSPGGTTMFNDDKDIWNLKVLNDAVMLGGLGEFSANNIKKALAGKNASSTSVVAASSEKVSGSASPSDLKTLFELIYLQFTGVRIDDDAFTSFKDRVKPYLDNMDLDPNTAFKDTIVEILYNNNPRNIRLKSSDFDKIDYHRMIEMYKERFADASDFVFTFVGNIDKDSIRPLMEQYLATLPSLNRKEKADEKLASPFFEGKVKKHFPKKLETPMSTIGLMYTGKMPYNFKNSMIAQLISQILDLVYTEKIRNDNSGSYSVYTSVLLYDFPEGRTSLQIYFDTNPIQQDDLKGIVKSELERIAKEGPQQIHLENSRLNSLKVRKESMQNNGYWLGMINDYYYVNLDYHTDYEATMNSITTEDIKSFLKEFLDQGNEIEVVMFPAADTEDE